MEDDLKEHLTAKDTWLRGLFMLVFVFLLMVARVVLWAVVILQFLFALFTSEPNKNLSRFALSLSRYFYQCYLFVTFNSEQKPFPFDDWPDAEMLTAQNVPPASGPAPKRSSKKKTVKKKSAPKKATAEPAVEEPPASESPAQGPESTQAGSETDSEKPGGA
jgi:hypothetical protein